MSEQSVGREGHPEEGHEAHVVPMKILVGVFAALLVLTWLTVFVAKNPTLAALLDPIAIWVALGIALVKASLVVLYFMHLRWDSPFNAVVFIGALLFVVLFISISLMDSAAYQSLLTLPE
jgi:cytochrome c oxidase subunit 4